MIPGVNPRQMQQMMKRMGISQSEIDASEVIIKTKENTLLFKQPQVSKVNMMGQETYQIVGTPSIVPLDSSSNMGEEDIKTVMDRTGRSKEEAIEAIKNADGNLAEAILKLTE